MAPDWEEIATELKGHINVAKVNGRDEANEALVYRFGVKNFPTFILIKEGQAHWVKSGPINKKKLLYLALGEGREGGGPRLDFRWTSPVPAVVLPEDVVPPPELPPPHEGPSDVVTLTDGNFEHLVMCCCNM